MADYGVGQGFNQGLVSFLDYYRGAKKDRREEEDSAEDRAFKKMQQQKLAAEFYDLTGNYPEGYQAPTQAVPGMGAQPTSMLTPKKMRELQNRVLEINAKEQMEGSGKRLVVDPVVPGFLRVEKGDPSAEYQSKLTSQELEVASKRKALDKPDQPQVEAATFGKRMEESDRLIGQLKESYDPTSKGSVFSRALPEMIKPGGLKQTEQAERNFLTAVLRKESGATITNQEMAQAALQYFPRPGDNPGVIAQKAQNRAQAMEGMRRASGPEWSKVKTVPSSGPKSLMQGERLGGSNMAADKPKKVIQNGHEYILNEKTGKYE